MRWLHSLLFIPLLSLPISAAPTQPSTDGEIQKGRSFKVARVRRGEEAPNGLAAIKRAYAKFGIVPTEFDFGAIDVNIAPTVNDRKGVEKAGDNNEDGVVNNVPTENDVQYLSPVTIGGQKFVMNFDTGSSDLWVMNTQLPQQQLNGQAIFDPKKSQTFSDLKGATYNITYGDASFSRGTVGKDTVDIGGATVKQQAIGLPTEISQSFATDPSSDGLVGLGFASINTVQPQQQKTFLENLAPNLDQPVLAAQLKKGAPGTYEFGKIDQTKFAGQLINVSVDNSRGFWEFKSSMFMIGDNSQLQTVQQGVGSAIADTGTSLMLVNQEIVQAYYAQVEGAQVSPSAGGFVYPCDAQLPDLLVSVGDKHLARIPGKLITFAVAGQDMVTGKQVCFGGVQSNQGSDLQIYGDVFFKSIFTVFDLRGPSLGFAGHA